MKNSILKIVIASLFSIIVLTGCSMQSEEEAIKDAKKYAENVFNSNEKVETNHTLDSFSMFLPENLEVAEEDMSNVVLKDGDQTYIVFYNSLEDPLSKLSYKVAATKSKDSLLLETFEDPKKFGYMRILPHKDENKYELQVGVGGVKITTYTTKGNLDNDSKEIMKIARSIVLNDHTAKK